MLFLLSYHLDDSGIRMSGTYLSSCDGWVWFVSDRSCPFGVLSIGFSDMQVYALTGGLPPVVPSLDPANLRRRPAASKKVTLLVVKHQMYSLTRPDFLFLDARIVLASVRMVLGQCAGLAFA